MTITIPPDYVLTYSKTNLSVDGVDVPIAQHAPQIKSRGQQAYEDDVKQWPTYDDGTPRKTWAQLSEWAQQTWRANPTKRGST